MAQGTVLLEQNATATGTEAQLCCALGGQSCSKADLGEPLSIPLRPQIF